MVLSCVSLSSDSTPFSYTHVPMSSELVQTINIWVDKNFGEADKDSISRGIDQWNYALNGYIRLNIVSLDFDMEPEVLKKVMQYHGWLFLKISSDSDFISVEQRRTLAFVNSIGGNIIYYIRDRIVNEGMYGITMHETGHLLGAYHSPGYLMDPYYSINQYRCVDKGTMVQITSRWHLDMKRINYCEYGRL